MPLRRGGTQGSDTDCHYHAGPSHPMARQLSLLNSLHYLLFFSISFTTLSFSSMASPSCKAPKILWGVPCPPSMTPTCPGDNTCLGFHILPHSSGITSSRKPSKPIPVRIRSPSFGLPKYSGLSHHQSPITALNLYVCPLKLSPRY